ncbi:MAG: Ig-like domain-containing protein [candidate division Zixibacteria bacterium]|nr:Ig-like domain-containing protein [candidate division Zixibacteria bacterium]
MTDLASSPSGERHVVTWDAEVAGADGYDVRLRLKVSSNPDYAGLILWPEQTFQLSVGRVDSRPRVSIIYPQQNTVVFDSMPVFGQIWDPTNFDRFELQVSRLPDTTMWDIVESSSTSYSRPSLISMLDLSGRETGDYILRTIATDNIGNQRVTDRQFQIIIKQIGAPAVTRNYPPIGARNVPANAPVVVQFDQEMNQPSVDNRALALFSEIGESYTNSLYDYKSRTLTIIPDKLYSTEKFHYYIVNGRLPSQQGVEMGGEFVSSFNSSLEVPTDAIDSLIPSRGETQTPVAGQSLQVYYNRSSAHSYVSVFSLSGDTLFAGEISGGFSPGEVPLFGLLPKTYYLVRISDVPTFDGDSDYMSYFITADTQFTRVLDFTPNDRQWLVGLTDEIKVRFNKPINVFTVDSASFLVAGPEGRVPGTIEFGIYTANTATFKPDGQYLPGTVYTVTLSSHIQDNLGNPIEEKTWSFTTGIFGTIGHNGGSVVSGSVDLLFPLGVFQSETEIGVGIIPSDRVSYDPMLTFAGVAIDIIPSTLLDREAILTVDVPDSILNSAIDPNQLKFYYYDTSSSAWDYSGGSYKNGKVSLSIDRLGQYGLFESDVSQLQTDFASSVSLIPRVISPRTGNLNTELNVSFKVAQATEVSAMVYSTSGRLIKTIASGSVAQVGENLLSWDGRGDNGSFAADGLYILVIEADGQRVQQTFVILNK